MSKADELAERLAIDALDYEKRSGNSAVVTEIGKIVGASSSTLQDAFLTAVRVLRAEAQARAYLAEMETKGESSLTMAINADD
ncbi:MAG: hypothetical protein WBN04_08335 [Paracoccaceae bacterium]